ncbi:microtubule-associated protein 6 isoform X1 [Crotalus tigris]|uniref:microtubule-associated protein 6 isoform X1 n=1 Tax=Crotalus tigris TaxID=88082 RepID=UPI00192F9762|nr:microtubule-associated protein 6 isoform X1 [Crotalus tigris]
MAWPCISRACCIARFWNQLDKADISVPLVFTKYSEATELPGTQVVFQQQQPARPLPSAIDTQPAALGGDSDGLARPASGADPGPGPPPKAGAPAQPKDPGSQDSVMRHDFKAWKVQGPQPSCKPRSEYHPSDQPFARQSQYQKDFRPWPIPKRGDHPWIPKEMAIPAAVELDKGAKERSSSWERRNRAQIDHDRLERRKEEPAGLSTSEERLSKAKKRSHLSEDQAWPPQQPPAPSGSQEAGKGRAVVDALNRQIKQEVTGKVTTSSYRNEFRPWTDIKPVRAIKAKSQYEPPDDKIIHQTSYSSQFTAEGAKPGPPNNKFLEHRRIRTLYSEPQKESPKVEKPSPQPSKPKKTTPSHKSVKKPKDKQMATSRASKKKSTEAASRTPTAEDKEKSPPIKPLMLQLRNPSTLQQEYPMEAQT